MNRMNRIWNENKQKVFGFYEFWAYVSVGWVGYECGAPRYRRTFGEDLECFSRGVYKAGICWLLPPLGIKMMKDELKKLDFHPSDID